MDDSSTFFCLYHLRMTPDQVAYMTFPEDTRPDRQNRRALALMIADRWQRAVRNVEPINDRNFHPRPDLDTNKDADAWAEHYRLLRYDLKMTAEQVAYIDLGGDVMGAKWRALTYEQGFPVIDVAALIARPFSARD